MRIGANGGDGLGFGSDQALPDPVHLVFIGQSMLTIPATSSVNYAMAGLDYSYDNRAIAGVSFTILHYGGMPVGIPCPPADDRIWPYLTGRFRLAVFLGGTTDIATDGDTGATAFADLVAFSDAARANGADACIAGTIPPGTDFSGGEETERLAFNSLLLADAGDDFDGTFDVAAAPLDDYTDLTYFNADERHWNATGAALAGGIMQTAILAVVP